MAYTAVPTVTTGELWSAADHNTYIRDNMAELVAARLERQGGSATIWATAGSTDYAPGTVRIQVGSFSMTWTSQTSKTGTVTFPTAFGYIPLIMMTADQFTASGKIIVGVDTAGGSITATDFDWIARPHDDSAQAGYGTLVNWIAIGPP